jgi:uncharacterized protein YbjT (DUF2867 family)
VFVRPLTSPRSSSSANRSTLRSLVPPTTSYIPPPSFLLPNLYSPVSPSQLETVAFDYNDKRTYSPALNGVTTVYLLTTYTVDMLTQSKLFIDAAKRAGVQFMVHSGVDLPATEPLKVVVWHAMIEAYIESSRFQGWTHLHPTFYMEVSRRTRVSC